MGICNRRTTQSGGMHRRSNAAGTFATGCLARRRVGSAIPAAAASRFSRSKANGPAASWPRRTSAASATADLSSRLSVVTASSASAVCGERLPHHATDGAPSSATAIEKISESPFRARFAFVLASTVRRSSFGFGARTPRMSWSLCEFDAAGSVAPGASLLYGLLHAGQPFRPGRVSALRAPRRLWSADGRYPAGSVLPAMTCSSAAAPVAVALLVTTVPGAPASPRSLRAS